MNALVFLVGSLTPIPAVTAFCLQVNSNEMMDFVLEMMDFILKMMICDTAGVARGRDELCAATDDLPCTCSGQHYCTIILHNHDTNYANVVRSR